MSGKNTNESFFSEFRGKIGEQEQQLGRCLDVIERQVETIEEQTGIIKKVAGCL